MLTFDDMRRVGTGTGGLKNDDVSNYIFENRGKVLMYFMDGPLDSSQIELFFESD